MHDASQTPKQSFKEWLRQFSDDEVQVFLYWLSRSRDNPEQPWDGARPTCKWLGGMEIPYPTTRPDEKY